MACKNCSHLTHELLHALDSFVNEFAEINQESFGATVVKNGRDIYHVHISKSTEKYGEKSK